MKGRAFGRELFHKPDLETDEALLDLVRARVMQGHDRDGLPDRLDLEFQIDPRRTQRALAAYDEEQQLARKKDAREYGRAGAAAFVGGAMVFAVVDVWGGMGAALLSAAVAAVAIGVIVLVLYRRSA